MSESTPILEFDGISKHFGGVTALEDVTFSIPRGGVHALVGENGAGKSTLIRIIGGIHQPDAGRVLFDGAVADFHTALDARDAGISIVHQEIPICPHLTATQNIFLGRELPKSNGLINWKEANRQAAEIFETLKADINPAAIAGRLPIAKQQLVEIAQALSMQSKLVIMDEPTSALGKKETDQLFEIIHQLTEQGITIVYVSHRLEEVFEIADYITALRDGAYINTVHKDDVTPDDIVQMMVGREIDELFPKVQGQQTEEVVMRVRDLSVPGVFENVSFDLHRGEVLGLVGLQGSGTSEAMRALFGKYRNVTGEVVVNGQPVTIRTPLDAIRSGIAYIPADRQGEGLFPSLTVRDNGGMLILQRIAKALGWVPRRALNERATEAVNDFSIRTGSIHHMIGSLSGGNQQKVVVAKSLSTDPLVVLMDDPTRGVDVGAKAEIHHLLNRITAEGNAVLLVSSELPEVLAMSDRVMVMYKGEVKAMLPHDEAERDLVMSLATGVAATLEQAEQVV